MKKPLQAVSQPTELVNPPIREVENLASATECTGLIPSAIQNESDAEHYARLFAIHQQKPDKR